MVSKANMGNAFSIRFLEAITGPLTFVYYIAGSELC